MTCPFDHGVYIDEDGNCDCIERYKEKWESAGMEKDSAEAVINLAIAQSETSVKLLEMLAVMTDDKHELEQKLELAINALAWIASSEDSPAIEPKDIIEEAKAALASIENLKEDKEIAE